MSPLEQFGLAGAIGILSLCLVMIGWQAGRRRGRRDRNEDVDYWYDRFVAVGGEGVEARKRVKFLEDVHRQTLCKFEKMRNILAEAYLPLEE